MKVVHVGIVNSSNQFQSWIPPIVIKFHARIIVLTPFLSGTAVENLRLQQPAQPSFPSPTFRCGGSSRLGLQPVLRAWRETGNILQSSLSTRHPPGIQSSGVRLPPLDPPEPGLWQERPPHQPAPVLRPVHLPGLSRARWGWCILCCVGASDVNKAGTHSPVSDYILCSSKPSLGINNCYSSFTTD